jgi:hypothetical protein
MVGLSGSGSQSCGKFVEKRRLSANGDYGHREWFSGFVTGHNWYSKEPQFPGRDRSLDYDAAMVYAESYCRANPTHIFLQAVLAYIRDAK